MLQRTTPLARKTPMRKHAPKKRAGRDKGYLAACKGEPCYLKFPGCRLDPEDKTVVPAHRNQGKGMGLKTHDRLTVPACHFCHALYDQSGLDRNVKRATWEWAYNQWEGVRARKMGGTSL